MRFFLLLAYALIILCTQCVADTNLSFGYGFAILNPHSKPYRLTYTKGLYDFFHFSIASETPIYEDLHISFEPFFLYQKRPKESVDVGFTIFARYYLSHFFISIGCGMAYTGFHFEEQGTRFPFVLQGGIGLKYGRFFIEDRFRHYSNGGISRPNMSINSNLFTFGIYFR